MVTDVPELTCSREFILGLKVEGWVDKKTLVLRGPERPDQPVQR
jgi:hypothetical protein